jgi:hypothetical protein
VWSTEHDPSCPPAKRERVKRPAAQFTQDQLQEYPVAVVTHKFFGGPNSNRGRLALRNGKLQPRALAVIDEKIDDVNVINIALSDAERVRETVWSDPQSARDIGPNVDVLLGFMRQRGHKGPNLEKPTVEWKSVADQLTFFTSAAAADYARHHPDNPDVGPVFAFAQALARGYAFITRPTAGQHTGRRSNAP